MNEFKKQNGITLIALVITIIILLILSGISLSAIIGNNGILNKSTQAKQQTDLSQEKEYIAFFIAINYMKMFSERRQPDGSIQSREEKRLHSHVQPSSA